MCGLTCSGAIRYRNDRLDYRGLVVTVFANNSRILRIFVILGAAYAFAWIHQRVPTTTLTTVCMSRMLELTAACVRYVRK